MTPEAQRAAIAKACPGTFLCRDGRWRWRDSENWWDDCRDNDPLSDLNAMHEAEKVLNVAQRVIYEEYLVRVVFAITPFESQFNLLPETLLRICYATAAQRAEAFLRTLNLWIE